MSETNTMPKVDNPHMQVDLEQTGGEKPVVQIFWTGGWDSSFRIAELSRMPVKIQPIYIHGDNRHSIAYERRAMKTITRMLQEHPDTQAEFLPMLDVDLTTITPNEEISAAYRRMREATRLGTQMEYLALYAAEHPGIELGMEKLPPEESHLIHALITTCDVKDGYKNGVWETYVDTANSQKDGALLFGGLYLPILDRTERDMVKQIKEWGYMDIMKNIWFCHEPYQGGPCGMCHPCEVKMNAGMEFLLPPAAQKRFHLWQNYGDKFWYKVYKKVIYHLFWKNDKPPVD